MEKDLIERVGKPAIRVPEGYFEGLGERLGRIPSEETVVEPRAWMKLKPYLALAACFAIAFAIGTAILKTTVSKQSPDQLYNETVFADMVSVSHPDLFILGMEDEDGSISDEDIINYLIDTGVSAEQIEFERQEE
jgi:hypothetical protein